MPQSKEQEPQRRVVDRWHVGKEIPIALVMVLIGQTIGFIWSISGLYSKVDVLVVNFAEFKQERYTKEDARRDQQLVTLIVEAQRQRDNEQERRISILETLYNQIRSARP